MSETPIYEIQPTKSKRSTKGLTKNVTFDEETAAQLAEFADARDVSMAAVIREAVELYLKNYDKG